LFLDSSTNKSGKYIEDGKAEESKEIGSKKDSDEKLMNADIQNQIKQSMTMLHDEYLEKHSQRLRELMALRQE
jgi:hypothetical protein